MARARAFRARGARGREKRRAEKRIVCELPLRPTAGITWRYVTPPYAVTRRLADVCRAGSFGDLGFRALSLSIPLSRSLTAALSPF